MANSTRVQYKVIGGVSMKRSSLNKFEISGDDVHFMRDGWTQIAFTTYRGDYYDELSSVTWTLNNGYLRCKKYGLLHRYIMSKWYGEDVLKDLTEKGYVVDHMNNDGLDCRVSNLEFLKSAYNVAKGQAFDVDSKEMRYRLAVNIFKDFKTGCYQISIGCNDAICGQDNSGNKYYVNTIKLLFNCDYSIVINDAENILRQYETEGTISVSKTHACDVRVEKAIDIQLTEDEKKGAVVMREGVPYLVIGAGHTFILSAHFDEGWLPHETKC